MSLQSLASPLGEPCRVFFSGKNNSLFSHQNPRIFLICRLLSLDPTPFLQYLSANLRGLALFSRSSLLQLNQRGHSNTQPRNTNRKNPPLAAHALPATLPVFFLRKEKLGFNKYPVCSSYTKDSGPPPTPYSAADAPLFSLEPPALTLLKVLVKHYKKATSDLIPELRGGMGYLEHP